MFGTSAFLPDAWHIFIILQQSVVWRVASLGKSISIYASCPAVCFPSAWWAGGELSGAALQGGDGSSLGVPLAVVSIYTVTGTPLYRPLRRGDVGAGSRPDSWFLGGSSQLCAVGAQPCWHKFLRNLMFLLETMQIRGGHCQPVLCLCAL